MMGVAMVRVIAAKAKGVRRRSRRGMSLLGERVVRGTRVLRTRTRTRTMMMMMMRIFRRGLLVWLVGAGERLLGVGG